jgi:hypothetical protein
MDAAAEGPVDEAFGPQLTAPRIPTVPDALVRKLVTEIDLSGVAVLPDYLHPDDLKGAQAFVASAVARAGGEYVVFNGKAAVAGSVLAKLPDTPAFTSLIRRLYEAGARRAAPKQRICQVLRCLAGRTGRREAYIFHFDSYVLTLLLPILIPPHGQRGDLVIAPNLRGVRPFYALNLLDKLVVDNKLSQIVLRRLLASGLARFRRIEMTPGSLYMFWGYRTLHANEPCDLVNIRSTALFHFGDPHAESPLRRWMGRTAV